MRRLARPENGQRRGSDGVWTRLRPICRAMSKSSLKGTMAAHAVIRLRVQEKQVCSSSSFHCEWLGMASHKRFSEVSLS